MTISTLAFSAPISWANWPDSDRRVLRFYAAYGRDFGQNYDTTPSDRYYADKCEMIMMDRSVVRGGQHIWDYVGKELYGPFPKASREIITFVVVSDDEVGTHEIHLELTTSLHTKDGKFDVPQAFTYVLGRADDGKGTEGLQCKELRCYYDMSLIERAKADLRK